MVQKEERKSRGKKRKEEKESERGRKGGREGEGGKEERDEDGAERKKGEIIFTSCFTHVIYPNSGDFSFPFCT